MVKRAFQPHQERVLEPTLKSQEMSPCGDNLWSVGVATFFRARKQALVETSNLFRRLG